MTQREIVVLSGMTEEIITNLCELMKDPCQLEAWDSVVRISDMLHRAATLWASNARFAEMNGLNKE